jgi:hypothetical protein
VSGVAMITASQILFSSHRDCHELTVTKILNFHSAKCFRPRMITRIHR